MNSNLKDDKLNNLSYSKTKLSKCMKLKQEKLKTLSN